MKTFILLLKTEIKQGKWNFTLVWLISFFLGVSLYLSVKAEQKIEALTSKVSWNADLVILPKGVTLEDFRNELLNSNTTDFLPEALFETTLGLSNSQFNVSAVLPITDSGGARIMQKGSDIGLGWLKDKQTVAGWQEQSAYETPEWGHKLIAGFFAAGSETAMKNLKQLIDKKTVAQAIWIKKQQAADDKVQSELNASLAVFGAVLFLMALMSFASVLIWLKARLSNTFTVLDELGFSEVYKLNITLILGLLFALLPVLAGILFISQF